MMSTSAKRKPLGSVVKIYIYVTQHPTNRITKAMLVPKPHPYVEHKQYQDPFESRAIFH